MPITWNAENDRKLLLNLVSNLSTKDMDIQGLAALFPGATPKAISEHIAKLRRELKAIQGGSPSASASASTTPARGSKKNDAGSGNATGAKKARGRPKKNVENVQHEMEDDDEGEEDMKAIIKNERDQDEETGVKGGVKSSNESDAESVATVLVEGPIFPHGGNTKRKYAVEGMGEKGGKKMRVAGKGIVKKEEVVSGDEEGMEDGEVVVDEDVY